MPRHLDNDYVNDLIARLERIPENAVPRWGQLRREGLLRHLVWSVRHSMGRSRQVPFVGNWFTRRILGPLILKGLLKMPKNVRLPREVSVLGVTLQEPGDIETLHALLEEYLNLVQADDFTPGIHPAFGDIGIDGWDRLHVLHFEHHLRQFEV